MRVVAIIPARYGSSRFPGKPLALIAGKPLLHWVYQTALKVAELAEVYVATDDRRIQESVQELGGRAIMTREDHLSGSDRLAEAARQLALPAEAMVVNIQGDQIVFPPPLISRLVQSLAQDPEAVMATPIRRLADPGEAANPNTVKVVFDRRQHALYFSRAPIPHYRDETEAPGFYKHLGIYVYRNAFLQQFVSLRPGTWELAEKLEQLRALEAGYKIKVVETSSETLEVDTPADARRAEAYLLQRSNCSQK